MPSLIRILAAAVLLLAGTAAALCAPPSPGIPDCEGRIHRPLQPEGARGIVLFFVTRTCPAAGRYAPEMKRLAEGFGARGVRFYLVEIDPAVTAEEARQYARDYGFSMPLLLDREHRLVKRCQATVTPECAVIAPEGTLFYRGRIDDRYYAVGRAREAPTRRDLAEALEALLAGRPPAERFTRAFGCLIPPLEGP